MVYLSELTVNVRRHEVRSLFADTHALHRWVMRAFPSKDAGGNGRILYRAENGKSKAVIIVQSDFEPNWDEHRIEGASVRGPRLWNISQTQETTFSQGNLFRFRLLANPIVTQKGKRHPLLKEEEQVAWLQRKGAQNGFELVPVQLTANDWMDLSTEEDYSQPAEVQVVSRGMLTGKKSDGQGVMGLSHYAVEFDGILRVTDSAKFVAGVKQGIGPAKGFGFGLLSVARVQV